MKRTNPHTITYCWRGDWERRKTYAFPSKEEAWNFVLGSIFKGSTVRVGYHILGDVKPKVFERGNLRGGICDAINLLNQEVNYHAVIIDWIEEDRGESKEPTEKTMPKDEKPKGSVKSKAKTIDEIVADMRSLVETSGSKRRTNVPQISVRAWLNLAREIEVAGAELKAKALNAYNGCLDCDTRKVLDMVESGCTQCLEDVSHLETEVNSNIYLIRSMLEAVRKSVKDNR